MAPKTLKREASLSAGQAAVLVASYFKIRY